jgi:hypothetical protein
LSESGNSAKVIFQRIIALFTDELGPIGPVLAQEALDKWKVELEQENLRANLRHIGGFVRLLAKEIDNVENRNSFINNVYKIEALIHYKQYFNE